MANSKKPKQLYFNFEDKDYILEFNRKSCEETDVKFSDLERMEKEPELALDIIPRIWSGAFLMHHPSCDEETKEKIYDVILGKDKDLPTSLIEMYADPLVTLFDSSEGNLEWKKNW